MKRTTDIIGLTGGAGSGKSTAARYFRELGARVLDADRIGHDLLKKGSPCHAKIIKAFGPSIVTGDRINRKALGKIVFGSKRELGKLNKIVHPYILKRIKGNIANIKKSGYRGIVIIDAALIIQWGWKKWLDYIIMINAPVRTRLERMRIKGISSTRAKSIMAQQLSPRRMRQEADWVIENRSSMSGLQKKVLEVWRSIK